MIKYLGSKRILIPTILHYVEKLPETKTVLDLFSGTSRVGHALKEKGYVVTANDLNTYAYTLAKCYVEANSDNYKEKAEQLIKELNCVKGYQGFFTESFCINSKFIQPSNGEKIDAIRDKIEKWSSESKIDSNLKSILLVSLMEAADRVDSTCGVQMAYLKSWATRSYNNIELRLPKILPGEGRAWLSSAEEASSKEYFDLVYMDPPYNQHNYLGNYHIWESLVLWDKPNLYGKAQKREDVKERKSAFNSKKTIKSTFSEIVRKLNCKYIMVSFNDEGFLSKNDILEILYDKGSTKVIENPYKRYIGSQIGIYNNEGKKVGKEGKDSNIEYLFICSVGE